MNYRKNEIKLRLSDEELAELNRYVRMTGMSREQYIRTVLKGIFRRRHTRMQMASHP